jgi:hypothetical protein
MDETDSGPQPRVPDSGHYDVASDAGGERWAILASLINSAKLHGIDPLTYLSDVLDRIVSGQTKSNALRALLPWQWKASRWPAAATAA